VVMQVAWVELLAKQREGWGLTLWGPLRIRQPTKEPVPLQGLPLLAVSDPRRLDQVPSPWGTAPFRSITWTRRPSGHQQQK